jgi:hypothetical protein
VYAFCILNMYGEEMMKGMSNVSTYFETLKKHPALCAAWKEMCACRGSGGEPGTPMGGVR